MPEIMKKRNRIKFQIVKYANGWKVRTISTFNGKIGVSSGNLYDQLRGAKEQIKVLKEDAATAEVEEVDG